MKKVVFLVTLLVACYGLNAQATISTVGGDAISGSAKLSYTVGQVITQPAKARVTNAEQVTARLNEGVQQAYSIEELKIDGATPIATDIKIYPNPTTDIITVSLGKTVTDMRYELYDVDGHLLQKENILTLEHGIDMRDYPAGAYLLRVVGGKAMQSYRIVKAK